MFSEIAGQFGPSSSQYKVEPISKDQRAHRAALYTHTLFAPRTSLGPIQVTRVLKVRPYPPQHRHPLILCTLSSAPLVKVRVGMKRMYNVRIKIEYGNAQRRE